MLLYGKNSVYERIRQNPKSIKKIFIQDNFYFQDEEIEKEITFNKIALERVFQKKLYSMKRSDSLQGILAEIEEFKYADFEDLLDREDKDKLTLIFLDRVFDPQNLGAIIRTTACFGNFAIVIPKHKACPVTDTALHIACGGENIIPIARVTNFTKAILSAKKSGYWVAGSTVKEGKDIFSAEFPFPLVFVLGSESKGIRYGVDKHLDMRISIPMKGLALSFNVTAASAIFCYEITNQRKRFHC